MAMKQKTTKTTPTKATTPLRDQCLSHCATLGIPLEPAALDELLSRAEKEGLSAPAASSICCWERRPMPAASAAWRAAFAKRTLRRRRRWRDSTGSSIPKAFDRVQIEELATGDFIRRRTNLVLVGWSGIGKSHIIQALGQKACVHGYRVLYRTSAQLLADLTASLADKTLPARLRRYASPDLLIID